MLFGDQGTLATTSTTTIWSIRYVLFGRILVNLFYFFLIVRNNSSWIDPSDTRFCLLVMVFKVN